MNLSLLKKKSKYYNQIYSYILAILDNVLKNRDIILPTKLCIVIAMVFPVVMYGCELDHKEDWILKNWCFWTVVLEKSTNSPSDSKEIKSINPKGNQPWIFIEKDLFWSWRSNTLATWFEEQTHWKKSWYWESFKGEKRGRGWQRMWW